MFRHKINKELNAVQLEEDVQYLKENSGVEVESILQDSKTFFNKFKHNIEEESNEEEEKVELENVEIIEIDSDDGVKKRRSRSKKNISTRKRRTRISSRRMTQRNQI